MVHVRGLRSRARLLLPCVLGLTGAAALPWTCADAHLLNMTTVQVDVAAGGGLVVDLKIDLTRAAGGSLEYYRLSQIARPLASPETRVLLDKLAAAVSLRSPSDAAIPLALTSAEFPTASREAFLEPLSWPMTHVVLSGRLPPSAGPHAVLQATFSPSFHFEEPIALTFAETASGRHMTRWLVSAQTSPAFEVTLTPPPATRDTAGAAARPAAAAAAETAAVTAGTLGRFVAFGFLHILPKGLDHVLFVLGLYLGARSLKSLLILITCFTLAHSITLGLATLRIIAVSPRVIEPLIAASIAWVAVENCFRAARRDRFRPMIVFGFGLLHGLGFASALSVLDVPKGEFLASLLSFNVGIELGQLTVIAGAFAATGWAFHRSWYRPRLATPASVAIACIAAIWTVQRLQ